MEFRDGKSKVGDGESPLQVAERECDKKEEMRPEVSFKSSKREGLWRNSK